MSKRNNKKKGKQEITQDQLHAMAKAWRADNEAGRVVMLFSLSECETVCANILGAHRNLHKLIAEEVIPALQRVWSASNADSRATTPLAVAMHPRLVLSVQHQVIFSRNERCFV